MVNIFGDSIASGSGKKVVTAVAKYKDYIDEIRQSYELGFTPYRLDKNEWGIYVTPIRVYDGGGKCTGPCCHDGGYQSIYCNGYRK